MDSQETLVNPIPPKRYSFLLDSVQNTLIFPSTRLPTMPTYTVATDVKTGRRTEVQSPRGRTIAVWKRNDILADTITRTGRGGRKSTTVNKWLKKVDGVDGVPVHTLITSSGPIIFRSSLKHRIAAYFPFSFTSALSIDETEPIAYLKPKSEDNYLELVLSAPAQAEAVEDDIVLAMLVLEHNLRLADAATGVTEGSSSRLGRWRDMMYRRNHEGRAPVVSDQVDCFVL